MRPAKTASLLSYASLGVVAQAQSSGCGKTHDPGFHDADSAHSIVSGGVTRTYAVNVPNDYNDNPNLARKVIFDYHGAHDTPKSQWDNSQYFAYPRGEEYLVFYPAGVNKTWQSAPYAAKGIDDLQFTTDLLAHVQQEYCLDSEHVYASGKSNGAGFVDFLACNTAGNQFAAFAMASAALYSDNSEGACTIPRAIMESHGQNDTTISYYGGPRGGGKLPNIRTWITWWAERDGCKDPAEDAQVEMFNGYERISYNCNGYKDVVVHYDVFGLGHCWPSSSGNNSDGTRSYCSDHALNYTPKVLDFFSEWNLTSAP